MTKKRPERWQYPAIWGNKYHVLSTQARVLSLSGCWYASTGMVPVWILAIGLVLSGCAPAEVLPLRPEFTSEQMYRIDATYPSDADIERLLARYANPLRARMNMVIAQAPYEISKAKPEGTLGNLSADILRYWAVRELGHPVDIAVVNNGGLRVPLPPGNITVGHIYELMPFENTIAVLKMNGKQVQQLANEIAAAGGEPVSGIRFRIENDAAVDVLVGWSPVSADASYYVATNSWMADGGGDMPALWNPLERIDIPVLIRDAMIAFIRLNRQLEPKLEQRIRY